MSVPRVSFLMAVHDDAPFLPATIRGVLGQTFGDFEVVAVDDASTDETPAILRASGDPRVRVLRNERNLGQVRSLNRGLRECRGELIARIDGDDICESGRLMAQVRHLDAHPELAGCATWTTEIDEHDREIGAVEPCGDPDYVRWSLCHTLRLYHSTMTVRRRVLEAAGGYGEESPAGEDYRLWARLVGDGARLGVVERRLVRYRRRPGSVTSRRHEVQRALGLRVSIGLIDRILGGGHDERTVGLMKALLSTAEVDADSLTAGRLAAALALMAALRRAILGGASGRARRAADAEAAAALERRGRALLGPAPGDSARLGRYVATLPGHRRAGLRLVAAAARCAAGRLRRRALRRGVEAGRP